MFSTGAEFLPIKRMSTIIDIVWRRQLWFGNCQGTVSDEPLMPSKALEATGMANLATRVFGNVFSSSPCWSMEMCKRVGPYIINPSHEKRKCHFCKVFSVPKSLYFLTCHWETFPIQNCPVGTHPFLFFAGTWKIAACRKWSQAGFTLEKSGLFCWPVLKVRTLRVPLNIHESSWVYKGEPESPLIVVPGPRCPFTASQGSAKEIPIQLTRPIIKSSKAMQRWNIQSINDWWFK